LTIQFYMEFVREALMAACDAVAESARRGTSGLALGRGSFGDTTYEVDRAVEDRILKMAAEKLPPATVISEERGIEARRRAKITLLMDPVDGSTNAKRGVSVYSTSLAIAEGPLFSDIFVAGVVDHVRRRMVWGRRGAVYEDWTLARPSQSTELRDAVIAFDSKLHMVPEGRLSSVVSLMTATRYPRILSTAALETACVAAGRLDAFVAPYASLRSFDCLPSIFLVREAGGSVDLEPSVLGSLPLDGSVRVNYVAAGNPGMLRAIGNKLGYR